MPGFRCRSTCCRIFLNAGIIFASLFFGIAGFFFFFYQQSADHIRGFSVRKITTSHLNHGANFSDPGRVEEIAFKSKIYSYPRKVWIYTPPGYESNQGKNDLLVVFDGWEYLNEIPLPAILDSLITAKKIPPVVALLIDDSTGAVRLNDLANRGEFARFVGDELMPWVRQKWNVTLDPHQTIICGSSAGGLASAYIALQRPDLFGKVLSQSGAFWRGAEASNEPPYEWLTEQYGRKDNKGIRFFLDVGSTETRGALQGAAPSILDANRHLKDVLIRKGYTVSYFEVPGGAHAPEFWRLRLPAGLVELASNPSDVKPVKTKTYSVVNAHSHNDYEQQIPFWLAYNSGFGSIEADIFLVDSVLYVAHDRNELKREIKLENEYLQSIVECLGRNNDNPYADSQKKLQILIDIKTDSLNTLNAFIQLLKKYPSLVQCKNLDWVITGNRPDEKLFTAYPAFIHFDGELHRNYSKEALAKISLMSDDFKKYSLWNGEGDLTDKDVYILKSAIEKSHHLKKPVRFWNAPDNPNAWTHLINLQVDYINTDHIQELAVFLQ